MEITVLPSSFRAIDHAFRSALVGIQGAVFVLEKETLTPDVQFYVEILKISFDRLLKLAEQLSTSAQKVKIDSVYDQIKIIPIHNEGVI